MTEVFRENKFNYWAERLYKLITEVEELGFEVSVEKDGSVRVWDYDLHHFTTLKTHPQRGWYLE